MEIVQLRHCKFHGKNCQELTTDERQPCTNYENNGNEYLIIRAVVGSEYSNIRYGHLIIGNVQNFVWSHKVETAFPLQVGICYILSYIQIIKRNNQIIKMNNQIFKITIA